MIKDEIKKYTKDIQEKAEKIGFNYLEQKYSDSGITEDDIEREYQEGIESGTIEPPFIEEEAIVTEETTQEQQENELDEDEYYYIDNNDLFELLKNEGFITDNESTDREIKDIIYKLWEDQTKMITNKTLNEYSIKRNGLSFRKFLFCEEYIKTGRITDTSDTLGIGRTTCYEYLKDKEVQEYLDSRRKEIKEESDRLFKEGFMDCFQELHDLITNKSYIQDHDKIKAIDCYLRHYENTISKETEVS